MPAAERATGAPRAEYDRRLAQRRAAEARWSARSRTLSNLRLAVFGAGVVLAWFTFAVKSLSVAWPGAAFAGFAVLVVVHDRALRRRDAAARATAFYEAGVARLEHRWPGTGNRGERFRDSHHLYAEDLDVFGPGSLFERLCSARTRAGEDTLARWLLGAAEAGTVRARQAAVRELAPGLDLREAVALLSDEVRGGLHPEALRGWGEAPPRLASPLARAAAPCLSAVTLATLAAWIWLPVGPLPFQLALLLQVAFAWRFRSGVTRVVREVGPAAADLELLARLLERIESERFRAPLLAELCAQLETNGVPASRRVARLRLLVDLLDARRNQLFAPVGALLLWTTQLAFALERWRATCGPVLSRWIETVGEIEALSALAGFAFEHPGHPFPELLEAGAEFDAEGLGHPLLPEERCVRNDLRLGGETHVLVVSGSNMSGKSTLLRSVGTNAVLALAGAPVCASRLRLSRLAVGASIRVSDSLLEGSSRFYAEIRRLRQIMQLTDAELPVLFLLDEILHGTNSHDRGIGAEAVVRGLLERGALGLVTTHDLALARVAEALAPRAANVHFEDHLEDGKMAFDYRLRPGVVEKSNALELMRAVGLEV